MMNFRLYIILLVSCHIFLACNEGINGPPSPITETTRFSLDSLIMNCNAADTSDFAFLMGIQTVTSTCLYDSNPGLAMSASDYDFSVSRLDMQPTFTDSEVVLTPIPFVIADGDTLYTSSYPFYSMIWNYTFIMLIRAVVCTIK